MRNPSHDRRTQGPLLLEREERLRELGKVTGELLHDLGSALSVLTGRIALAREEASLGRIPADELARIGADSEELRSMVLEVLAEVRGVRPPAEATFAVGATLESVVTRWLVGAPSVSATLHNSLPATAALSGARSFFSRAVGNLLRNAARHARSEIRLSARPMRDGRWVEIRVEDDGPGVPEELQDLIFEPLISGTQVGTGLGLSFARWGIERLGGDLVLDPEPSGLGGACFRITLPLSSMGRRPRRPGDPATRSGSEESPRRLQGICVVIVDDDDAVRNTFARLLRRSGARPVEVAPLGKEALAETASEIARYSPDVVLLDLSLGSHSGLELAEALRKEAPPLFDRIILFTGGTRQGEVLGRAVMSKLLPWQEIVDKILKVSRA